MIRPPPRYRAMWWPSPQPTRSPGRRLFTEVRCPCFNCSYDTRGSEKPFLPNAYISSDEQSNPTVLAPCANPRLAPPTPPPPHEYGVPSCCMAAEITLSRNDDESPDAGAMFWPATALWAASVGLGAANGSPLASGANGSPPSPARPGAMLDFRKSAFCTSALPFGSAVPRFWATPPPPTAALPRFAYCL